MEKEQRPRRNGEDFHRGVQADEHAQQGGEPPEGLLQQGIRDVGPVGDDFEQPVKYELKNDDAQRHTCYVNRQARPEAAAQNLIC